MFTRADFEEMSKKDSGGETKAKDKQANNSK